MSYLSKLPKGLKPVVVGILLLLAITSVAYAAPDGVFNDVCNTSGICRETVNSGSGMGLYGRSGASTEGAVRGYNIGTNGVGVYGRGLYHIGVRGLGGTESGDYGGYFSGFHGTRGIASGSNGFGIQGTASGVSGIGVYGSSTNYLGVRGVSSGTDVGDYGGYFTSTRRGLYANGAEGDFDGFFPNCISVNGDLYGRCAQEPLNTLASGMSMRAVNNDNEALAPGDVVVFNGVTTVEGVTGPILLVKRASGAAGEAVIGVVQSAYVQESPSTAVEQGEVESNALEPVGSAVEGEAPVSAATTSSNVADFPINNPDDAGHFATGNVQPGQQLFVQVQGVALVNVNASTTSIVAGESLVASPTGKAVTAPRRLTAAVNGLVVGRALESLSGSNGAIYVLLGVR